MKRVVLLNEVYHVPGCAAVLGEQRERLCDCGAQDFVCLVAGRTEDRVRREDVAPLVALLRRADPLLNALANTGNDEAAAYALLADIRAALQAHEERR